MEDDGVVKREYSTGKAVSLAIIIMVGSNIVSRLLGFGRMIVLADIVGLKDLMDAYSFSFLLPDILNHILAGSALSITFIPFFQDIFTNKSEKDAWRFFSNVLTVGTIIFLIFISLSLIYTKHLIDIFAGENITNDPRQFALTIKLTRIIIPAQLFFFWGALLNGVQYAKKRFLFPALAPLLYNIGIISGGIILFPYISIDGFSWGVLAGAFIGNVVVQIPGALRVGMKYKPYINLKDTQLIKWFIVTVPFILGLAITFSNEFLFRTFGSISSDGIGSIASLDYSYKAMMFLVGIFGQAFAAGIYPFVSQLAVEKKYKEMNTFILTILARIASVAIPVSLLIILLSENIIAILYQRGEFTLSDTLRTAKVFIYYLPGTFFMCAGLIIVRAYYSMKNTILPLVISTSSVVICLPFYFFLGGKLGAAGIAFSTSISLCITFFALLTVWRSVYKIDSLLPFFRTLFVIILFSFIGFFLCRYIRLFAIPYTNTISSILIKNVLLVLTALTPSLIIVGIFLEFFGISNFRELSKSLLKRFVKKD
jgi:putative peptidoglycan lipid II flippase